jgi:hypothetical protein
MANHSIAKLAYHPLKGRRPKINFDNLFDVAAGCARHPATLSGTKRQPANVLLPRSIRTCVVLSVISARVRPRPLS